MKKYTKAIAGAMALVSAVTAFSGCSGSGTPAASGATSSSAASTTGETQKQMSKNEGVQSAVDNVSAAEDYKDIKVDTKIKWMGWWDIQEASPAVEVFKKLYGTPANKPKGYESVDDAKRICKHKGYNIRQTDTQVLQSWYSLMIRPTASPLKYATTPTAYIRTFSSRLTV